MLYWRSIVTGGELSACLADCAVQMLDSQYCTQISDMRVTVTLVSVRLMVVSVQDKYA